MNFEIFAQSTLVIINTVGLLLATWMFRSDSKKNLKFSYFLMTIFMLLWANFSYFASRSHSLIQANILYRLNWVSVALFLAAFFYFFVVCFLSKGKFSKALSLIITIFSVILSVISIYTQLIIESVKPQSWGMGVVFGRFDFIFNSFAFIVAILVIVYSIKSYLEESKEMKRKLKFFLSGVFIFISANIVFNVVLQLLFESVQYQILGDFSSIFLLGFTAYSTIQYKLFDVKVVTSESLTALLIVILFTRIFSSHNSTDFVINIIVFLLALVFGFLLVRSVIHEVSQKEKLQELTKKLRELDEQKDEFLNVAAHELRAPMTAIKGYLSMISDGDGGKVPEKIALFLTEAANENDRLIRLVNNLLNISRIEEGRMTFEMGTISLSKVTETSFNSFKAQAKEKNLEFTLDIENKIHDKVYVDIDRIYEVVNNLISNAVKYTDVGFVKVKLKNKENKVLFEITDTGDGLTPEESEKLFQKFYRAESSINKQIGTGLGLYVSKLLIEKFKGKISFTSEKGKGSTFWFELPIQ